MNILKTTVITTFVFITLLFLHTLVCNDDDPELQLSNKFFFRLIIITAISVYTTNVFLSNSSNGLPGMTKQLDNKW